MSDTTDTPHANAGTVADRPLLQLLDSAAVPIKPAHVVAAFCVIAAIYLAAPILMPIALALYLNLLLSPLVSSLTRLRLPRPLAAGAVVLTMIVVLFGGISLLAGPAQSWFEKVPKSYASVKETLTPVTEPLEDISELAETVDELTTIGQDKVDVQRVTVQAPNLFSQLADRLPAFLLSCAIVLFLTYFFLSSNYSFLRKIIGLGGTFAQRRNILLLCRTVQMEISTYVMTVTGINAGLGILVAAAMYLLDVPNPILWGALAMFLNFVPYLGAVVMMGIMLLVGLTTFTVFPVVFAPALAYAGLSIVEGNLVTPMLVGRRLALQPSVVFIALIFWGWMWGIVGAALSIPIMVALKIILERSPRYRYLGVWLHR